MRYLPYITTALAYVFLTIAFIQTDSPRFVIIAGYSMVTLWFHFYLYITKKDDNDNNDFGI